MRTQSAFFRPPDVPQIAETAGQQLQKLRRSALYKVAPKTASVITDEASKCLDRIVSGEGPLLLDNPTAQLSKVYSLLPHFYRAGAKTGQDAWADTMGTLDAAETGHDLEVFVRWSWLGSALDRSKIEAKRDEITAKIKAAKAAGKKGGGTGGKGGRGTGGGKGGRGKGSGKAAASDDPGGSEDMAAALSAGG